jgi:hypothetical protein
MASASVSKVKVRRPMSGKGSESLPWLTLDVDSTNQPKQHIRRLGEREAGERPAQPPLL